MNCGHCGSSPPYWGDCSGCGDKICGFCADYICPDRNEDRIWNKIWKEMMERDTEGQPAYPGQPKPNGMECGICRGFLFDGQCENCGVDWRGEDAGV